MGKVTYIALKQMKDGDKTIQPGDPVPQAAGWKSLRALLSARWLVAVTEVEAVELVPEDAPLEKTESIESTDYGIPGDSLNQLLDTSPGGQADESQPQSQGVVEDSKADSTRQGTEEASNTKDNDALDEKPERHLKAKKEGK